MNLKHLRRNLPSFAGGPLEHKSFDDNTSYIGHEEQAQKRNDMRVEVIKSQLQDLPENADIEAELSFPGVEGLEEDTGHYSGKEEVMAAYQTWMADHDMDEELLSYDIVMYPSGGEFEVRLEEIEGVYTSEWRGPHHADRRHERNNFEEVGGYESLTSVSTGDTVAVLEGEYERSV